MQRKPKSPIEEEIAEYEATSPKANVESLTALTQKQWSPLVIRKITRFGFPIYVALITDDNVDDLDQQVVSLVKENVKLWKNNSLQSKRNLAGLITDTLLEVYDKTEGVAVVFYVDKTVISSLHGDFMNHMMCRYELYTLLHMSTGV